MDSRPIKFNKSGKYNLDFIDWNNEWERVGEIACKIENGEPVSDPEEEEAKNKCKEFKIEWGANAVTKHFLRKNSKK